MMNRFSLSHLAAATMVSCSGIECCSMKVGAMHMKKLLLFAMLVSALAAFGTVAAQAGIKVQICHIPPGNPANLHQP